MQHPEDLQRHESDLLEAADEIKRLQSVNAKLLAACEAAIYTLVESLALGGALRFGSEEENRKVANNHVTVVQLRAAVAEAKETKRKEIIADGKNRETTRLPQQAEHQSKVCSARRGAPQGG